MSTTLTWLPAVLAVAHVLLSIVAILVISARRRPTTAIAWALLIIFVPYLGALAFFLVGFSRLPRRRCEKQREVSRAILDRTEGLDRVGHRDEWPAWIGGHPGFAAMTSDQRDAVLDRHGTVIGWDKLADWPGNGSTSAGWRGRFASPPRPRPALW